MFPQTHDCGSPAFQNEFESIFQQLLLCMNQNFENCIKHAVKIAFEEQKQEVTHQTEEVDSGFISRSEAIRFLQISPPTLHRYQKAGLLPYHKIGRKIYFNKADLVNATRVTLRKKGVKS